ncbi:MAG: L,D-transpeptidase [bacterium]
MTIGKKSFICTVTIAVFLGSVSVGIISVYLKRIFFANKDFTTLFRNTERDERLSLHREGKKVEEICEEKGINLPIRSPKIVIIKSKNMLSLYEGNILIKSYSISLGLNPVDDKIKRGDCCTPEGEFYICQKRPWSQFGPRSMLISYPNIEDAERGLQEGLISRREHDEIVKAINRKKIPPQNTRLGSYLFIHGEGMEGNGKMDNWTLGCIAMFNEDIEELYEYVEVGTPIFILKN